MEEEKGCRKHPEQFIEEMTLEEKASLLSGKDFWQTKEIGRLGIPSMFLADGPHGLRKQMAAADHLGLNKGIPATCFPTAAAVANSWDTALGEEIGRCLGREAAACGVQILLGPGLNIKRSPLCGRNFEYFSEDPLLSGKMAAAYIRGIQSQGVGACPKHFAVNNQEHLRLSSDSVVDERTLREIYLTGFEIAVKEGNPLAIMSSYNRINGSYSNESSHLLIDILRKEWGFEGIVVSDWGGSNSHTEGVRAGSHLEMPGTGGNSDVELVRAVKEGRISEAVVDERVQEYLKVLLECKAAEPERARFDKEEHHRMACRASEESIVLLKNEENILPLQAIQKIAVIGDFARRPRYQGAGSSLVNPLRLDNTLELLSKNTDILTVEGYEQGFERNGKKNSGKLEAACRLAARAEAVLIYLGLDESQEAEGKDRSHMRLARNQIETLAAVSRVNPNIIAVLSCGSAVEMDWQKYCKAIVHGYLSGQAGAQAMLNVLTGKAVPSGKLAETYPKSYEDTPAASRYPGKELTAEYREGLYVGYRYYDKAQVPVEYPFGFGLSYTAFEYRKLNIENGSVRFLIQNTGRYRGAEIAQLYVRKEKSHIFRPEKELKGFCKVWLEPGEEKEVEIAFDDKTFRYYNPITRRFESEGGSYDILIGASLEDIRLKGTWDVSPEEDKSIDIYDRELLKNYFTGDITRISDREFEALLGHKIPEAEWDRKAPLQINDTFAQLFYARGWLGKLVFQILKLLKKNSEKKGKPDLNLLSIYGAPFRSIAKMSGGAANMEMAEALLEMFNGHFFPGAGRFIKAFFRMKRDRKEMEKEGNGGSNQEV